MHTFIAKNLKYIFMCRQILVIAGIHVFKLFSSFYTRSGSKRNQPTLNRPLIIVISKTHLNYVSNILRINQAPSNGEENKG